MIVRNPFSVFLSSEAWSSSSDVERRGTRDGKYPAGTEGIFRPDWLNTNGFLVLEGRKRGLVD